MTNQTLLQQAISAVKKGQKAEGKRLLAQLLEQDPRNIKAWLWLTEAVETDEERLHCLQKVLEIDSQNEGARWGVQRLQVKLAASQEGTQEPEPEQVQAAIEEPEQPAEPEELEQPAEPEELEQLAEAEELEQPAEPEEAEQLAEAEELEQPAEPEAEEPEQPAEPEELEQPAEPQTLESLVLALRDKKTKVRLAAAEALGEVGDPRTVKFLIATLRDWSKDVRRASAEALGKIGDPRAAEPLAAVLGDQNSNVRQAASEALVRIGQPAVEPLIDALQSRSKTVRQMAAETLVEIGQPAVNLLVPVLQHWERHVREKAAETLDEFEWQPDDGEIGATYWIAKSEWDKCAEIGELAVEPLIAVLKDLDNRVRLGAAKALGKIGDLRAVEPLVAVLKDRDDKVRQAVTGALVRFGEPALEPLAVALQSWNSHRIRQRVVDVLDELGWQPDDGVAGATYWIAKGDWDKCIEIGQPAVEPLVATMRDQDSGVRWAAAEILDELGWQPDDGEIGATYWIAKSEWNRCVAIGEPAVEPLIAALWDQENWVQQAAAGALERIRTPEALAAVEEWEGQRKLR